MTEINAYYDYSLLSMAAYALDLVGDAGLDKDSFISAGFMESQYNQFISDDWAVVNQSSDALYGSSGFSATLFHNTITGEYVFANRGTAGGLDLYEDAWGIVLRGMAGTQIIDMYRYYKQLTTTAGQAVQYSGTELSILGAIAAVYGAGNVYATATTLQSLLTSDTGLGKLSSTQSFSESGAGFRYFGYWGSKSIELSNRVG